MNAATLERDVDGCAILTTEQAVLVARILCHDWTPPPSGSQEDALWWAFFRIETEREDGCIGPGGKFNALARWVLQWAPVIMAAEHAYDAAADQTTGGAGTAEGYQSAMDAVADIYDAVRAALGEKAK